MGETVVRKGPRRADAQHNYEVILAAARAAVAERGGDIVLEEIARTPESGLERCTDIFPPAKQFSKPHSLMRPSNFVNGPKYCNRLQCRSMR